MKGLLKLVGVVVGILVVAVVSLVAVTFMGRQSIVDGFETNGIRIVKDGFGSVAVVPVGPDSVALIDAGNDKAGTAILAELARRRLGPDAVTAILLTHGHPDHIAAIGVFPKARVMALAPEVALVEGRVSARGPFPRLFPARPTGVTVARALSDGDRVALGSTEVRVYSVPGHTAGSAAYLVNGVLFMGDAADQSSSGEILGAPWVFSDSQAEDRASLVRLNERLMRDGRAVKTIAFAHSGTLTKGLQPLSEFATRNR